MIPFPDVPYVTGTVKECSIQRCFNPAKVGGLCNEHAARRFVFTVLQLAGLALVTLAGFLITPWLGVGLLGASLLLIGLVLEGL